jgi:hypothetical protein
MSKLIDKLERASRGSVAPMGFGGAARKEKVAPVLLLGSAKVDQENEVGKVVEAGLDGALLVTASSSSSKQVASAAKLMNELPWGLWQPGATPTEAEKSDFQVIASEATPLTMLGDDDRTTVMALAPEMGDSLLRAIDDLPVDAFLLSLGGPSSLTVGELLQIGRVRRFTSKYLLLHLAVMPSLAELKQLRDAGVHALVIDVAEQTVQDLRTCQSQLLELPPPQPRNRDRARATLPVLQPGAAAPQREEEDEEEEYDD